MVNPRLSFALEQLGASDWRLFERFASEFLADEFPGIRTTANPSGDRGRDAELFVLEGDPRTAFQYSVTESWKPKIASTAAKIADEFRSVRRLIYCTNQEIGALADSVKSDVWTDHGIQVDVRDRSWFAERAGDGSVRATAAEELAQQVADPILQARQLVTNISTPLTTEQGKIALLQLAMNALDNDTERGLTKTSFESLVRAALVDTSAEATRSLAEVQADVRAYLPAGSAIQTDALTESALRRLSRRGGPIKQRNDTGEFHLSFNASQEWKIRAAEYVLDQEEVERDLTAGAYGLDQALDEDFDALKNEAKLLRMALESLLMQRGEAFAGAVVSGQLAPTSVAEVEEHISSLELPLRLTNADAAKAILSVLDAPSERTRAHLTSVLDAYTLFAFLQQTPDVQRTLARIFDGGEIWLDTTAVLPLLAERLIDDPEKRSFSRLLYAAWQSGLKLYATDGVIEEVNAHLDNSLRYVRLSSEWRGRIPFMYSAYMLSGRAEGSFSDWVADIKGAEEPTLDVREFLEHYFHIERRNLPEAHDAGPELRGAVQELWLEAHSHRRERHGSVIGTTQRLVDHDVENAVGVIQRRRSSSDSPLGYTAWWLTLDRTAFKLREWMLDRLGSSAPRSPVLSPDYLSQILRFGPLRRELGSSDVSKLPVSTDVRRFEDVPLELIELAKATRELYSGYDELRVRREVRDALNRSRSTVRRDRDYAGTLETEIIEAIQA